MTISAATAGPGNPRGYLDGQLYGIGYQWGDQPVGYHANPWLFLSVLIWDGIDIAAQPTWNQHIRPILQQYGNLYPIMSQHLVDLGDYNSVVANRGLLSLAFSLPVSDPNYMPVTRDLSKAKSQMLLYWLDHPGPDGLPLKGHSVQSSVPAPQVTALAESVEVQTAETSALGGKTAFLESLNHKCSQ